VATNSSSTAPELSGSAAAQAAQIRLDFTSPDYRNLEQSLRAALAISTLESTQWQETARALLVVALAGQPGREADARRVLPKADELSAQSLWAAIRYVAPLVASAKDERRRAALAALELDLTRSAGAVWEGFDADQRRDIPRYRAAALAASDRAGEALTLLRDLAQQHPENRAVQEELGELLLGASDPATLRQALEQWRRIAARCRPRTAAWFRAKYNVALAQYKLGDKAAAARLIRYLQLTEDLTSSGLSDEFRVLLRRCE
jgi:hypothetical protein